MMASARQNVLIAVMAAVIQGGCVSQYQLEQIGQEPPLSPVGSGLYPDRTARLDLPGNATPKLASNSTWRDSGADIFRDPRAARVGDVVTVKIQIKDKATLDNTSTRSRDAKGGLTSNLKYDLTAFATNGKGDASLDATVGRNTSTDSKGGIERSESIDLLVAAVVTDVLPNGNLVISGTQEVRVNFEVRVLNVAGVVRARDIATDNSVAYDKIAEARISYGGRGRITEVQQPGFGQQLTDMLSPF